MSFSFLLFIYCETDQTTHARNIMMRLSAFPKQKEPLMLETFYRLVLYNWNKQTSCYGLCGCIVVVHCWFGHVHPAYVCHSVAVEVLGLVLECFTNMPY